MGTRDDEYDYLFKGMACGAQMDEVPAADKRAEVPSRPLGPGRSPGLGVRRDRTGQACLDSFGPAGLRARGSWDATRQGWSREEVGPPAVGEAVGGEASGGDWTAPSFEDRAGWKAPVGWGWGWDHWRRG